MNHLIQMDDRKDEEKLVFEKNMLFATLDTNHRNIKLEDKKEFILIDTVGFVSKLPHALVQAFKATLEEVIEADLLLHVVDGSNENYQMQIDVTDNVLSELGVIEKETVLLFNKMDLVNNPELLPKGTDKLQISALKDVGIDTLIETVKKRVFKDFCKSFYADSL